MSPNSLMLGRNFTRISSGPFNCSDAFSDDPKHVKTRFHLVQSMTNQFWKTWQKLFFPTLLIRQKWHHERRNLEIGDVMQEKFEPELAQCKSVVFGLIYLFMCCLY